MDWNTIDQEFRRAFRELFFEEFGVWIFIAIALLVILLFMLFIFIVYINGRVYQLEQKEEAYKKAYIHQLEQELKEQKEETYEKIYIRQLEQELKELKSQREKE